MPAWIIPGIPPVEYGSVHAGIYWLIKNATTCMELYHIGIYGIIIYNDVVNFRALGVVAIMGDLNCRIGNMKDYIDNEYDHNIIIDLPEPINNILDEF